MRQPVTHRAVWNHSVLELGGFLFNDFSRAEWRINKIYYTRLFEVALSLEYWAWTWTLDESIWISRLIHAHTHHMQIQIYVSLSCTHIPVPACSQTFLRVLVSATELLGETCGGWFQLYNVRAQPDQFLHIQSKHAFVINDFHKTGAICNAMMHTYETLAATVGKDVVSKQMWWDTKVTGHCWSQLKSQVARIIPLLPYRSMHSYN